MQIYAIKMHNFFRFGESNNCVVFDITPEMKQSLEDGFLTFDDLYAQVVADPVTWVKKVKKQGVNSLIGILGKTGDNYDLSNGSGKSTILEAICYAHYDRIVRKTITRDKVEKAGDSVITRFNGEYPDSLTESYVEEIFEKNGVIYRIKRGRMLSKTKKSFSPILELDSYSDYDQDNQTARRKTETEKQIEEILDMDYDIFVNSLMFGQNDAGKFLQGTDKTRKEMLISILRLEDTVQGCLDITRKRKSEQIKITNDKESKFNYLEQEEKNRATQLGLQGEFTFPKYRELLTKYFKYVRSVAEECQQKISSLENEIEALKAESSLQAFEESKSKLETAKAKLESSLYNLRVQEKAILQSICDIKEEITREKKNAADFSEDIKKTKQAITETIQSFDEAAKKSTLEKLEKMIASKPKGEALYKEKSEMLNKLKSDSGVVISKIEEKEQEQKDISLQLSGNQDNNVSEFLCRYCKQIVSREHLEKEYKEIETTISNLKKEEIVISENMQKLIGELSVIQSKLNLIATKEQEKTALVRDIELYQKFIEDSKNNEMLGRLETYLSKSKDALEKALRAKNAKDQELELFRSEGEKIISVIEKEVEGLENENKALESKMLPIQSKIDSKKLELVEAKKRFDSANREVGRAEEIKKTVKNNFDTMKVLKSELENDRKKVVYFDILDSVFGLDGIQTKLIERHLPLLNEYVQKFLDILSSGNLRTYLVINDKGKVDISVEGGSSGIYEMCSGGEKTLIRLAVDIALGLLTFARTAQRPQAIFLDEVFGPLDESKTETVFQMLELLEEYFGRVVIISHKPFVKDMIDYSIIVNKDIGDTGYSRIAGVS